MVDGEIPIANRPGWSHLAFEVDDVAEALQAVLAAGGSRLGEVVTFDVPGAGTITWTYARDPEGNIIELQSWS
jgi:predicted enzyme related to lactoylglutathione lyase